MDNGNPGRIVLLNGAPRSGKSSIVDVIQKTFEGVWMNLGVDAYMERITPRRYWPGIGLRPGGELPEIERLVPVFYAALYESIAAHSRLGLNVVADVGHHEAYGEPRHILADCARRLIELPVLFVGVRCSIETIMERRNRGQPGREGRYLAGIEGEPIPQPILAWQREIHRPGIYDLEVNTSSATPEECAALIHKRLQDGPVVPTAFQKLAAISM
ncbi:chloramphenicol phosphotransferase [Sinorhizobium sp. 7-81]|uniref:phosphotransferase-like protein n=1 Tax=Sinorhizobium sp. 8-89 TaxID=3049089 RepID=UPI0024C23C38|nr:chloramphenicol phosphotransferase [Sinorhizobium sp. 8-89]MDK1492319.1 chloramphenicol phosphotransferase [Sinorhizobium sp. 8-89]